MDWAWVGSVHWAAVPGLPQKKLGGVVLLLIPLKVPGAPLGSPQYFLMPEEPARARERRIWPNPEGCRHWQPLNRDFWNSTRTLSGKPSLSVSKPTNCTNSWMRTVAEASNFPTS